MGARRRVNKQMLAELLKAAREQRTAALIESAAKTRAHLEHIRTIRMVKGKRWPQPAPTDPRTRNDDRKILSNPGLDISPEQLASLENQYAAPSATNADCDRMTYDDVIIRAASMFAVIVGVGAVSWHLAANRTTAGLGPIAMTVGAVGAFVLGILNSLKRQPSPMLILAYAVFEGAVLDAFSGVMEYTFPGIVLQARLVTCATFAVVLCAYKFAGFRVSGRAMCVLLVAMGGYLLFSLVNFALMVTGVVSDSWGLRGLEVMGIPLSLIIGVVAVLMAAFNLAMDFEAIQRGVGAGLPTRYAEAGAFGLVATIVWLYVEFLRTLAILRDE